LTPRVSLRRHMLASLALEHTQADVVIHAPYSQSTGDAVAALPMTHCAMTGVLTSLMLTNTSDRPMMKFDDVLLREITPSVNMSPNTAEKQPNHHSNKGNTHHKTITYTRDSVW
jgi:hypothetical protein